MGRNINLIKIRQNAEIAKEHTTTKRNIENNQVGLTEPRKFKDETGLNERHYSIGNWRIKTRTDAPNASTCAQPRWSRDGQTKGGISWRVGGLYTIERALNVKLFVRISAGNNNTANNCKWCENRQKSPEISYNQQKFLTLCALDVATGHNENNGIFGTKTKTDAKIPRLYLHCFPTTWHATFSHDFGKRRPIFNIFSLAINWPRTY